jgi:hypothetical protein
MHEGAENEGDTQWRGAGGREGAQRLGHVLRANGGGREGTAQTTAGE